jgi:imidazolonepropionase
MNLLIKNIKQLVTVSAAGKRFKAGPEMNDLGIVENATVLIENGRISWTGRTSDFEQTVPDSIDTLDAEGLVALPGFVDSHTHALFAGTRENEFALRSAGKSYTEIASAGGGILSTVAAVRAATKKELKKNARKHLDGMLRSGTTTVEIKSGYGLNEPDEIKMMDAINELADEQLIGIAATFLGAHAVPPEYTENTGEYVQLICSRILPYLARRKALQFCDVFCDNGFFSVDQARTILEAARTLGISIKMHADQLSQIGASVLAAELGAVSADHLEKIDDAGIAALQRAGTIATVLPGVSFFLNEEYSPARKIIGAGVPLAIASDFNPGSNMSFSMPLMMTIACTQMRLTPEEAITAATLNGAAALNMSGQTGSIEPGKQADIIFYDVPNYRSIVYHYGTNFAAHIVKHGTLLDY